MTDDIAGRSLPFPSVFCIEGRSSGECKGMGVVAGVGKRKRAGEEKVTAEDAEGKEGARIAVLAAQGDRREGKGATLPFLPKFARRDGQSVVGGQMRRPLTRLWSRRWGADDSADAIVGDCGGEWVEWMV